MTEAQSQGQVEGWRADPYGRHELRFYDGQRWTPFVRDGDTHGMDEPGGPVDETRLSRSSLLDEGVLVVERSTDLGRRWSERSVLRADGTKAGVLSRIAPAKGRPAPGLRSLVGRDGKSETVELVDDTQTVVLTLVRPAGVAKSTVELRDQDGRDAGRVVQQSLRGSEPTCALLGPAGHYLGDLHADSATAWDLRMVDSHGQEVATISRDWTGLDPSSFPRPDDYIVRIEESLREPLRTVVVACALSLEIVVKPDSLGT